METMEFIPLELRYNHVRTHQIYRLFGVDYCETLTEDFEFVRHSDPLYRDAKGKKSEALYQAEFDLLQDDYMRQEIQHLFTKANRIYNYQISGINEEVFILKYTRGCFLGPHVDCMFEPVKLSCVAQLSDPSGYEGGKFLLGPEKQWIKLKQGEAVVFPSWMVHEVSKVTKGERISLGAWAVGERFR